MMSQSSHNFLIKTLGRFCTQGVKSCGIKSMMTIESYICAFTKLMMLVYFLSERTLNTLFILDMSLKLPFTHKYPYLISSDLVLVAPSAIPFINHTE